MSEILDINPGKEFGSRYQIVKELGRNAGRRTLLARDLQNQQLVVIKVLIFDNDFRWEDLKLFEREAETLKSLSHPGIPRYLDYLEINTLNLKCFALVQTYISAKSLQEYIKTGRTFSETEVKQLAKSLLQVLAYLHSHQPPVIHRDIKPSNILLANRSAHSSGDVYLVDFGSVQTGNHGDGTITIVGTYGYMPPEQFGGKAFPASDIYSLGATLIYLVTGTEPADLPQVDLEIQFETIVNISPNFATCLKKMIHPSLADRFTSAQAALQALESEISPQKTHFVTQKPVGSQIELTKTTNTLEIIFSTIDYQHLKITQNEIFLTLNYTKLKEKSSRILFQETRQNISKLVSNKKSYVLVRQETSQGGEFTKREEVPPKLFIWIGIKQYELGDNLSLPERDWLAQELSDFLGIPISWE